MKELLDRFVELERSLSAEKGAFALFALLLREDAGGGAGTSGYSGYSPKWDLVVAAPWIEADRKAALTHITKEIQDTFAPEELSLLSRVVLVDLSNPAVDVMNQTVNIQHGHAEVRDINFSGLPIKHAYIITSQRVDANEEVPA